MMPKKDGFTLAREIRLENDEIPIIFITAKCQTKDVVEGFSLGGNDCLKKPFSMEGLIVKMHKLLYRTKVQRTTEEVEFGKFTFNLQKQWLRLEDEEIFHLTHRESHLLHNLIRNKNEVLDRSAVRKKLWGRDDFFTARSMYVFISKLRKKLKSDPKVKIANVRGFGYNLIC